jgi:hypothetical protein
MLKRRDFLKNQELPLTEEFEKVDGEILYPIFLGQLSPGLKWNWVFVGLPKLV